MDQKKDDFDAGLSVGKSYGFGLGLICGVVGVGIIGWLVTLVRSLFP